MDLIGFWLLAVHQSRTLRDVLLSWDGAWIIATATRGWPHEIVTDASGVVQQTTWAWPPLVPLAARWAGELPGVHLIFSEPTGPIVIGMNLIGGLLAAVLLFSMLRASVGVSAARSTAVLWAALPATPIFLMGYADGVLVAFVFASLLLMIRHRYVLAALVLLPAGLTKASVVPFAVTLIIVVVVRRRTCGPAALSTLRALAAVGIAVLASIAWPGYVALRLGSWNAYWHAQSAWSRSGWPFQTSATWLQSAFTQPGLAIGFSVFVLAIAIVAATVVARDGRYPLAFRVSSVMVPGFLLVVGTNIGVARMTLPEPAIPAWLRRRFSRPASVIVLGVVLLLLRLAWIALFVSGSPGDPPP
jgi:hypothetical protein